MATVTVSILPLVARAPIPWESTTNIADAAVAVVLSLRCEYPLRAFDPEDATRRNGSSAAIRRRWWQISLDATDLGGNVAHKCNSNRRRREA